MTCIRWSGAYVPHFPAPGWVSVRQGSTSPPIVAPISKIFRWLFWDKGRRVWKKLIKIQKCYLPKKKIRQCLWRYATSFCPSILGDFYHHSVLDAFSQCISLPGSGSGIQHSGIRSQLLFLCSFEQCSLNVKKKILTFFKFKD